ncbi:hypothetical protein BGX24_007387 [Mortierella sp. AD032]|nr:hypothetical protein BGX24_007387 [Mortierella sp. AD032]
MDFSNRLRQLCWLLELNPGLEDLTVASLNIHTLVNTLLFTRAIARLTQLKHVQVEFRVDEDDASCIETLTMLFFCFPASLVSLKLRISKSYWSPEDNAPTPTVYLYTMLVSLILRDGPLLCLREVELPILKTLQLLEYRRILEH